MASIVSISNQVLIKLGKSTINSIDDPTEEARACKAVFSQSLDTLLQQHPWNFAMHRDTLAVLSETPEFEYNYKYQLPTDPHCLQVIEVDSNYEYKIEGRLLFTDDSSVKLKYIKRVEDYNELSPMFVEALTFYIAAQLAIPLVDKKPVKDAMNADYKYFLYQAKLLDSAEDSASAFAEGGWLEARG
jgi:hypothetical protein